MMTTMTALFDKRFFGCLSRNAFSFIKIQCTFDTSSTTQPSCSDEIRNTREFFTSRSNKPIKMKLSVSLVTRYRFSEIKTRPMHMFHLRVKSIAARERPIPVIAILRECIFSYTRITKCNVK